MADYTSSNTGAAIDGAVDYVELLDNIVTVDSGNNRIGINNGSPASALDVTGSVTADGLELATTASDTGVDLTLNGNKSTNGGIGSIIFENAGDSVGMIRSSRASANDAADMLFYTQATGGANTERMRIDASGNVGIGCSPAYPLEVVGAAGDSLTITARSGDATAANNAGGGFRNIGSATATSRSAQMWLDADGANFSSGDYFYMEKKGNSGDLILSQYSNADMIFKVNADQERLRIDSSGNVGIGVTPSAWQVNNRAIELLEGYGSISSNNSQGCCDVSSNTYNAGSAATSGWKYKNTAASSLYQQQAGQHKWFTAASGTADSAITWAESMRIDASGNLLVGTTEAAVGVGNTDVGLSLSGSGYAAFSRTGSSTQSTLFLNKNSNDGSILNFAKDGATVGSIGSRGGEFIAVGSGDTFLEFNFGSDQINPSTGSAARDNAIDLGSSGARFDDIFATNGTIQTSDRNEKQDIAELSDAEQRVAVVAKGLLRKFRWKDAVAEKGDEARTHFGIIAQDLQAAFAAEGLDAGDYAMFISTTWTDEETNEEKTRMGVRYHELLAFIIAAI